MLVFILFSFLLLAPALQGVWDFRTQFVFEAAVFLAGGFWLFRERLAGRLPGFLSDRKNLPLFCALAFSLLSSTLSPVRAMIAPEWWNFLAGACVLAFACSLTAAERQRTDLALRLAAWLMVLLSFYQAYNIFVRGTGESVYLIASLTNANALALFAVMLIPLAIVWKDLFLLSGLIIVLIGTMSMAVILGLLVGVGFYAVDNVKGVDFKKNRWLFAALDVVVVAGALQLKPDSAADRVLWWRSAFRMFADRPFLGFGQGAFAYLYPAFHHPDTARLASVYVHNYYLEFLAENGLLAFLAWNWVVFSRLWKIKGLKKYGLIAVLAHSVVDFGLAVPANFFVFCYILAETRRRRPAADPARAPGLVGGGRRAGAAAGRPRVGDFLQKIALERLHASAMKAYLAGDHAGAESDLSAAYKKEPGNPGIPYLLGQVRMRAGFETEDRAALFRAAVAFEGALALNASNGGA